MRTFKVVIEMSAENRADAEEMIEDYLGSETDVTIIKITQQRYR